MTESVATIEVWLSTLQQLFNSFDPSPFHERDLDRNAEEYIAGTADEFRSALPIRLVVHLPAKQLRPAKSFDVERAVRHYFRYRHEETRRLLRFHFREGRVALAIGVTFLAICVSLRQLALAIPEGTVVSILQEGLLILGWVAMWRPLQVLLYDWWPIVHRSRLYARLAEMRVVLRPARDSNT